MAYDPSVPPARFVEILEHEVRRGFSIIPLVGSGVSAPSGIHTGESFLDYLLASVWDALHAKKKTLRISKGAWPRSYSPDAIQRARRWFAKVAAKIGTSSAKTVEGTKRDQILPLHQEAIGALADWRSTLLFLSRLRSTDPEKPDAEYDDLGAPDPKVVDAFNYHLTRDHAFNLGHQMIAFLARLLRIRTVLTTNFDTLLEQAFAASRIPLDVFDVHLAGGLPDPRLVRSQLSLIKLHGSRFETRADLSLDSRPTEGDRQSFVQYFRTARQPSLPAHLLILGFSGRDKRIMALMQELIIAGTDPDRSRIFWVCHSKGDEERASRFAATVGDPQSVVITRGRADLLLFELYQRFVSTLPPAGSTYEFAQYTPPVAVSFYQSDTKLFNKLMSAIRGSIASHSDARLHVEWRKPESGKEDGRILVVRGGDGVSSLIELAFSQLIASGRHALWFELDDFCGADDLVTCILQCVAAQLGQLDFNVVTLSPGELDREMIRLHFRIEPNEWYLLLYGRQSAGTSAGWANQPWPEEEFKELWRRMRLLEHIGFTVVYMPLSEERRTAIIRSIRTSLNVAPDEPLVGGAKELVDTFIVDPEATGATALRHDDASAFLDRRAADVLKDVAKWAHSGGTGTTAVTERCRFLYVMSLFRQSRHLSALCSEAAFLDPHRFNTEGIDNDRVRMDAVERWTLELVKIGLPRRKEGGFLWMHRDLRETLRILLEEPRYKWMPESADMLKKRSRSHHWLAEWYLRAFRATGNFTPFVESFYHRLQCILHVEKAEIPTHLRREYLRVVGRDTTAPASQIEPIDDKDLERAREKYRAIECEINLREATKLLNSGKRVPVLNLEDVQRDALFSRLPPELLSIAERYGCRHLWEELDHIRGRLRTLASLQSRDPESVSGSLTAQAAAAETTEIPKARHAQHHDSPQEIVAWDAEYTRIKNQLSNDRFDETRSELVELLNQMDFTIKGLPNPESIRRATVDFLVDRRPSAQWRLIIKVLRRLAHLYLKETAIGYYIHEIDGWTGWLDHGPLPSTSDAKHHAATASSLLMAADRSGWFLEPSFRDSQMIEGVACQSLHGLALGYLDRFTEAQRKLDEASGSLAASSLAHDPLELAILELRRSTLFLLEARALRVPRSSLAIKTVDAADAPRAASARVEDSWRCVERAHELLAGSSRIVSWWERLYSTQLRALALNEELLRADGRYDALLGYPESFQEESARLAYRSALLLQPRRTRVIAYVSHCYVVAARDQKRQKECAIECVKILHDERKRLAAQTENKRPGSIVLKYLEKVTKRMESLAEGR